MPWFLPVRHTRHMDKAGDSLAPGINGKRLLERHAAIARIGATGRGGVNRQALTREDAEARRLLLSWTAARGYSPSVDPIGNLFVRRGGTDGTLLPVITGSHLDTQPTGGNFDGIFGVLAALEVLETLDDCRITAKRPIELVVWMNEEGSRFSPATMGSAVCAGEIPLEDALNSADAAGITVREALAEHLRLLPKLTPRALRSPAFAYIEAHIEQGPVLENAGCRVGVVNGIQGLCQYEIDVTGIEAHAGTTPMRGRRDALASALTLINRLRQILDDPHDLLRFTVGRLTVLPGSPNTVPGRARFTIDVRHPDDSVLTQSCAAIERACTAELEGCTLNWKRLLRSTAVQFDSKIIELVKSAAARRRIDYKELISGATHDAKFMAKRAPTGMLFIPCAGGISHNEAETARESDLIVGTQILCDSIVDLLDARGH